MGVLVITHGEPSTGGETPQGTSRIEFKTSSAFSVGDTILVQSCFAPDPTLPLPELYHPTSGLRVDLCVVTRNKLNQPDWVQMVVPHTLTPADFILTGSTDGNAVGEIMHGQVILTTNPVVPKVEPSPQFETVDLSSLTVTAPTTSSPSVLFSGTLADAIEKEVHRTGNYVDEREYWVRMTGPSGEPGPGLRIFIDRRSDGVILPTLMLENDLFTLSQANLSAPDPDGTGELFYESASISISAAGYALDVVDGGTPSIDLSSGYLVTPEATTGGSGPEHLLTLADQRMFPFVLQQDGLGGAKAQALAVFTGYGTALGGEFSILAHPGYGMAGVPAFTPDVDGLTYRFQTGTAMQNQRVREWRHCDKLLQHINNGTSDPTDQRFIVDRVGSYHPYFDAVLAATGQLEVLLFPDACHLPDGYRHSRLRMTHVIQRHHNGFSNAANGDPILPSELAALTASGDYPWAQCFRGKDPSERYNNKLPCFIREGFFRTTYNTAAGGNFHPGRPIGQESHPWNSSGVGANRDDLPVGVQRQRLCESQDNYGVQFTGGEGNHEQRVSNAAQTLAFAANMGYAKYWVKKEAAYALHRMVHLALDHSYDVLNDSYFWPLSNLTEVMALLTDPADQQQAGRHGTGMQRGNGMTHYAMVAGARLDRPTGRIEQEVRAWHSKLADAVHAVATTYGCTVSGDGSDPRANTPTGHGILQYPGTDAIGSTDLAGRYGGVPITHSLRDLSLQVPITEELPKAGFPLGHWWAIVQSFMPCYGGLGLGAVQRQIAIPGTDEWDKLSAGTRFIVNMYRHARRAGDKKPPSMVILSEGSNGAADPVGTGQGPWPGGAVRPGAWKMESIPYGASSAYEGFGGTLDHRQFGCLVLAMLNVMEGGGAVMQAGEADTSLEELVGFFLDWTEQPTMADALDSLVFVHTMGDEEVSTPYKLQWKRNEYGVIWATIHWLQAIGLVPVDTATGSGNPGAGGGGGGSNDLVPPTGFSIEHTQAGNQVLALWDAQADPVLIGWGTEVIDVEGTPQVNNPGTGTVFTDYASGGEGVAPGRETWVRDQSDPSNPVWFPGGTELFFQIRTIKNSEVSDWNPVIYTAIAGASSGLYDPGGGGGGGGSEPPAAPTNISATPGDGQVSINWS